MTIQILKSTGEKEPFDRKKLVLSLSRAGAAEQVQNEIVAHIEAELRDGMSTDEIYKHAHSLLVRKEKHAAIQYSIRKALLELGPSGFAFEQIIAELYRRKGYIVSTDKYVKGKCVEHEMDIIAHKDNELIMLEAKFHNQDGVNSDLKIALYVKARFDDLFASTFNYGKAKKLTRGILITNTKFTHTAIAYAECAGLELIGWNYPLHGNLHEMIEDEMLHPITCLTTLTNREKKLLIEKNVVILKTLKDNIHLLSEINISDNKIEEIKSEINSIF